MAVCDLLSIADLLVSRVLRFLLLEVLEVECEPSHKMATISKLN